MAIPEGRESFVAAGRHVELKAGKVCTRHGNDKKTADQDHFHF
jgi:hypothetical protein